MGFKENIQKLSVQITDRKELITNEEMTKQALIIPFFQVLGFDVFNPLEVRPEYDADFPGKKKGEKVDYALIKDGTPIMFIEAKSVNENLENHDGQLSRYFNALPEVRLGILTNGIKYKFFTDLNASNIMDESPFLQVDITDLKEADIQALVRFRKEAFDSQAVLGFAEELIYTSNLNRRLEDIFKNPPDEFIRYLIKDFSDIRVTQNVIDRFRPIVKKSISQALLNLVSQGLASQEAAASSLAEENSVLVDETAQPEDQSTRRKAEVITTEDELKSYELVKNVLLEHGRDVSVIQCKDTTVYFSIFTRNPSNWIVRLNLDSSRKQVITNLPVHSVKELVPEFEVGDAPKGYGISRVYINVLDDIPKLSSLLVKCFDDVVRD